MSMTGWLIETTLNWTSFFLVAGGTVVVHMSLTFVTRV